MTAVSVERLAVALPSSPHVRRGLVAALGALGMLLMVRVIFPAPLEILFNGAILGSLYGLIAMGLVLVYRSNRIINFSMGDLGGVAGVLMACLIDGPHWAFPLAVLAGVLAGTAVGGAVEVTLVRRFAEAPRLILTVVTILISTLLVVLQILLPPAFHLTVVPPAFSTPLDGLSFRIGVLTFTGAHVLVLITVPLVAIGLIWFFRATRLGMAVRACAESADRALLLGIPVKRVNTSVWVIAAFLSAIAAVLRTLVVGAPFGSVLGFTLLGRAIAAAVIARMENLWVALGAAIGIGVVEEAVFFHTHVSHNIDPVLFVIVLGALVFQSRGQVSRAVERGAATWAAVKEVRPIPPELRSLAVVRLVQRGGLVTFAAVALIVPSLAGISNNYLLSYGIIYGIIGLSLIVLTGWTGQISLGQLGFAGVGGVVVAKMEVTGHDVVWSLFLGGLAGAAAAVVVGVPALRLRGLFLAVATFMFTLACQNYFLDPVSFPWIPDGRLPARPILFGRFDLEDEQTFTYLCVGVLCLLLFLLRGVRRSRTGRVLIALRENERAAQAYGVNVVRTKLVAFAFSGFIAAVGGGLLTLHEHQRLTLMLGADENLKLFLVAVVGGLGSVTGLLSSVLLFQVVDHVVHKPAYQLLFHALGVLVILLAYRSGLGGLVFDLRDRLLRQLARRRGIHVPSLIADSLQPETSDPAESGPVLVAAGEAR